MDVRKPVMSDPEATGVICELGYKKIAVPILALTADVMIEHQKEYTQKLVRMDWSRNQLAEGAWWGLLTRPLAQKFIIKTKKKKPEPDMVFPMT
ncbi:MAG: hypothetical protein V7776_18640 [Halopseudomonas aestusnigri]